MLNVEPVNVNIPENGDAEGDEGKTYFREFFVPVVKKSSNYHKVAG